MQTSSEVTDASQGNNSSSSSGSQSNTGGSNAGSGDGSNLTQQNQQQAPVRPDAFADKGFDPYFDPKEGVKFADLAKDFNALRADKAQADLKRASLPGKPDDYKLELPNGFQLPEGVTFEFEPNDPRLPEIRKLAHEAGLDQGSFSRLLGIHAQYELGEQSRIDIARKAEIEKLGANGPARVDAVETWLKSMLGAERGKALLDRMVLASDLEGLEDLVKKFSSQGNTSYSDSHRERPSAALTEEQYQKLTPAERLLHTRKAEAAAKNRAA